MTYEVIYVPDGPPAKTIPVTNKSAMQIILFMKPSLIACDRIAGLFQQADDPLLSDKMRGAYENKVRAAAV